MKVAAQQELDVRFSLRQREYFRVEVILMPVADKHQQGLVRQRRDRLLPPVEQQTDGIQFDQKPIVGQKCDTHVNFLLDSQKGGGKPPRLVVRL